MKQLGVINATVLLSDIEGYVLFMADTLGWSKPEISAYIAHLRSEVKSGNFTLITFRRLSGAESQSDRLRISIQDMIESWLLCIPILNNNKSSGMV